MKKALFTALILSLSSPLFAHSAESGEFQEAPSTINAKYVEPSATRVLQSGEKIADLTRRNLEDTYILQRLSENTYWVQRQFYNTTFYVGKESVLLFDAPPWRNRQIFEAIREVTDLPVSTVVYSHNHADHVGDAGFWVKEAEKTNLELRIIATSATHQKQKDLKSTLIPANDIIGWPQSSFTFEDITVEMHGFDPAAHTDDHSVWYIPSEKVLHAPDLLNPDQLPFRGFAVSERFIYHEDNLKQALALDWNFVTGGHGNVGEKKDIEFQLEHIADIKQAVAVARKQSPGWGSYLDASKANNHADYTNSWNDTVVNAAVELLRPKYGQYYGFDASTAKNVGMVLQNDGAYPREQ